MGFGGGGGVWGWGLGVGIWGGWGLPGEATVLKQLEGGLRLGFATQVKQP